MANPPRWILLARDATFQVEPAVLTQVHGMSHTLYIGLGAVTNKFGIEWNDAHGAAAVNEVDSRVVYVSPEYYRVLWRRYLARVWEDPIELARIYMVKAGTVLTHRLPKWSPRVWVILAIATTLLWVGHRRGIWRRLKYEQAPILLGIAMVFAVFFVIQGTLAHPSAGYAYPIAGFTLLVVAICIEVFIRHLLWQGHVAALPHPPRV